LVHCEKTMFIFWAGLFASIFLVLDYLDGTFDWFIGNLPLFIAGLLGFGILGSLYYRFRKNKHPVWKVWQSN